MDRELQYALHYYIPGSWSQKRCSNNCRATPPILSKTESHLRQNRKYNWRSKMMNSEKEHAKCLNLNLVIRIDSGTEYFDSNIINYRRQEDWIDFRMLCKLYCYSYSARSLGRGGSLPSHKKWKRRKPFIHFQCQWAQCSKTQVIFFQVFTVTKTAKMKTLH